MIQIWSLLAFLAAAQGVFLSVILFLQKKGNIQGNRLLALLIMIFSLWMAGFASFWSDILLRFPHLTFAAASLPFLFGPLIYLYSRTILKSGTTVWKQDWAHFLPFAFYLIYLLPFFAKSGIEKKAILNDLIYTTNPQFTASFFFIEGLQFIQLVIYLGLSWTIFIQAGRDHDNSLQNLFPKKRKLVRNLFIGLGLYAVLDIFHLLEIWIFDYAYIFEMGAAMLYFSAFFVYRIGYQILLKPEILFNSRSADKKNNSLKYEKSSLTDRQSREYLEKLLDLMKNEKPYLNCDLNMAELAESLGISAHHLSQVINDQLNQNFFELLNSYRIEEAKMKLIDATNENTILGIAFDAGFNNKASFNNAFKNITGSTPSAFRRRHRNSLVPNQK